MKTITNFFKTLALIIVLASAHYTKAQVLSPGFTQTVNAGGQVTFSSTTAGASSITIYGWNFGDSNTFPGIGIQTAYDTIHYTYTYNGSYIVTLIVQNGVSSPTSAITQTVVVNTSTNTACTLTADFNVNMLSFGTVSLTNTSTGTTPGTTYQINYGDGSPSTSTFNYQYPYNGTFTVSLTAINSYTPFCAAAKTIAVTVSNATCNAVPGFTVNRINDSTFQFINTGTSSYSHISYWDFGDGSATVSGDTVSHTYGQSGNYTVQQQFSSNCTSYSSQVVSVFSTSCIATSNFTLAPSGTPQWWDVFPSYPPNVSNVLWTWGDGDTSNTLYPSHLYASAGTYTVCLSVTLTCGNQSNYCSVNAVYKSTESSGMVGVNVIEAGITTGIKNNGLDAKEFLIYPNPGNGHLNIRSGLNSKATIEVYSLIGKVVYREEFTSLNAQEINLTNLENGIYFVKVSQDSKTSTEKIVIKK